MALSLAQAGRREEASKAFTEAWETARIMEDAYWRGKALRVVALSLVQAGQGNWLWRSPEPSRTLQQSEALAAVALSLAQAGRRRSKQGVH